MGIILSSQQLYEVEKISDKVLFLKNGKPTHLNHANENKELATSRNKPVRARPACRGHPRAHP
jgi:ABC-2 type transport system ATP-binding protein